MRVLPPSLFFVALVVFLALAPGPQGQALAQGSGAIRVVAAGAESRFPDGILFTIEVQAPSQVKSVVVRFRVPGARIQRYHYLEFAPATSVKAEALIRTDTADRYVPPGTVLEYFFEVEDVAGNKAQTEPRAFTYLDTRFQWQEARLGPLSIVFYGPVRTRAETVLQATALTIRRMGPVLGVQDVPPLRLTMYNNWRDMSTALPPTSRVLRGTLVTQGTTFSDAGVILILGDDPAVQGIASHEVVHYLVDQAIGGLSGLIPSWLNEGLAEYGNIQPTTTYDQFLALAIARDKLLPITLLAGMPGKPDDVILFYGQARSIVRFMAEEYGEEKISELLRALSQGYGIDQALQRVYGVDRRELENGWRRSIGAPPLQPTPAGGLPSPTPWPTLVPFGVATPTPAPSPSPTPGGAPAPTATPAPAAGRGGWTCIPGTRPVALDMAGLLLLGGVAALVLRKRRR